MTIDELRHFAVSRSLFAPTTLQDAIDRFGFVQADPIQAPARAQDLTLRHRVDDYRAGDLERCYPTLAVEEDVFVNYGFVTRPLYALMHPRTVASLRPMVRNRRAQAVLAFVRERGAVHPRDVEERFSHGTVTNYWGGSSNATTHLLNAMHYRGLLRVVGRERGVRNYAVQEHGPKPVGRMARQQRLDAIVDFAVGKYAPLPAASLSYLVGRLRYAVPQWQGDLKLALKRAKERLSHAGVEGTEWYWPVDEAFSADEPHGVVRLLAPFDPVVWDRRRFEMLWGWAYRFEAYTPVAKRHRGYYALPLLWRDRIIGWGNVSVKEGNLHAQFGYVDPRPQHDPAFRDALETELERMRQFLAERL